MADFLHEIEKDLRIEHMKRLWSRYALTVVIVLVLGSIAIGSYFAWKHYSARQRIQEAERLITALSLIDKGDERAAETFLLALKTEGKKNYSALASFSLAGIEAHKGNIVTAIETYGTLSANSGLDQPLRDCATILAAFLRADREAPADLELRLAELLQEKSPWRFLAREIVAIGYIANGDTNKALGNLTTIVNDNAAPQTIIKRASELLVSLGNDKP